ncbi:MAG: PQQ-dependent sugar dehydrogenase [Planctomycetaceae bacterium]
MKHLITALAVLAVCAAEFAVAAVPEPFESDRLEKEVVVRACDDPMQLEVLPDGRVLFIERYGRVKQFDPKSHKTEILGEVPIALHYETGLLGFALDRSFAETGWLYLFFCPKDNRDTLRLSRFTLRDGHLDLASEIKLLDYHIEYEHDIHMGGGLYMDRKGNLHLGTGDNSPPVGEIPVDQRPGREMVDSFRSSANSNDLRGKVLRIHPEPYGTYSIPPGNLFPEGRSGRPEIYAMGTRNAFRLTVDEETGWVYWGDVGPNVAPNLGIGPNGYDEINVARKAGNFGWPQFIGPNEAYRNYDFATKKVGELFDVRRPRNLSRNNTGAKELPPPMPALIWYPSGPSDRFPALGSGGRSAMVGPVYHFDDANPSRLKLPREFDRNLFLYDWTRNWVFTATFDSEGNLAELRPFMPDAIFRKPIDMKFANDGTLYVIEYGDRWAHNSDSQIVRIVYARGNRAPLAALQVEPSAGRQPLTVRLDAAASRDRDKGQTLSFAWSLNGKPMPQWSGATPQATFDAPGRYEIGLTVSDSAGAVSKTATTVYVGNARPAVRVTQPPHGSFFNPGEMIRYSITAQDVEDGSTADGKIASDRLLLSHRILQRRFSMETDAAGRPLESEELDPGLALMRKTTCFSCHTTQKVSGGPPYSDVGRKYAQDADARERLAAKIINGGAGVWGAHAMPPHPQHTLEQTRLMVDWVLSLAHDDEAAPVAGRRGFFRAHPSRNRFGFNPGVLVLNAEYTDNGAGPAPPLRGEDVCVLHARRKLAASFDRRAGAEVIDVFERQHALVVRFAPGDWIAFQEVNLAGINRVKWNAGGLGGGSLSLHVDAPDGPEIARIDVAGKVDELGELFEEQTTPIRDPGGLHDLYVVAEARRDASKRGTRSDQKPLSLGWLEFLDSPETVANKAADEARRRRVLLIPTKYDHANATHMYVDVCRLLAACLNETDGIEATVSPELDWPANPELLRDVNAIVFYSRPAGDILLAPTRRQQAEELLKRGVGFTAIHWATGADLNVGAEYEEILGGWFNFAHSGLNVSTRPLIQALPGHPICRGWKSWDLRDEFYLNLKFSPRALPVLTVNFDGKDQTVGWVLERKGGGRSFGCTLGHFHDNYYIPEFRKLLINGILWTAGVDLPEDGAPIEIDRRLLELPPPQRSFVKEWKLPDLLPLLEQPQRGRSFAAGESLFRALSCAGCHRMQGKGGQLGPELTDARSRLSKFGDPRAELLREMAEPSHRIDEKFRSQVLQLADGRPLAGIVVGADDHSLRIAADPARPDDIREVPLSEIEERRESPVSLMPAGLLNTLKAEEILDLLAYVESGGDAQYAAFRPVAPQKSE